MSNEFQVPDPNGPPVLNYCGLKSTTKVLKIGVLCTLIAAAGGAAALVVLGTIATPTSGASRSHRIRWQQRQEEIDKAVTQSDAPQDAVHAERPHD